ncbi:hypothetical protein M5X11_37145 [Paenibacillus alginolyticus]|uniref:hypothetical protein n=1 Tax=Paenibacillus alginolyticus TaxID=59839 RepID=UPI0004070ECF|nr:hypothetical protein [Paenibacillus alginolyticus]MCY9670462.1 hypothetical protein [Paenibacillus alginolyticus]
MKNILLTDDLFRGAVSLEHTSEGIKLWRIPYQDYDLYPPNGIDNKAAICAGIRLSFHTDATAVVVKFSPMAEAARLDCLVNGELFAATGITAGDTEVAFSALDQGPKELAIFLPQNTSMTISSLWMNRTRNYG